MSYPILYSSTETVFSNNGLGILGDCVSCEVTEEANGIFELAMQYPMGGIHYEEIADRSIIKAKADQFRDPQLFRVYAISKPMSGIVTILAEHISYDLSGIPVKPFTAGSISLALSGLKSNAVVDCPFDFWTDKDTSGTFSVSVPSSIRSRLGGVEGSILDVYGGEFGFDNYSVKLYKNRGENRGVSIRYGKNLTDIKQEQNCASVATGVYPYWAGDVEGNTEVVELPERIINAPGTYDFVKIRALDLSSEFEEKPTIDQLREKAENYVESNNIGVPRVSLTVSFAQLDQSEEYKDLKLLERVSLFDTVNVEFPALGVSATAKAVKLVYDVLMDRVKSVTLGSVKSNIADTIVEQQQEIQKAPTKTDLERAKEAATAWLTNGKGYAYFRKDDSGNIVDILFMDTQDPTTAVNVMRVGQSGIGFSHNGVNGPYESAWTIDGNFVADFITTGTLNGTLVALESESYGGFGCREGSTGSETTYGAMMYGSAGATGNYYSFVSNKGASIRANDAYVNLWGDALHLIAKGGTYVTLNNPGTARLCPKNSYINLGADNAYSSTGGDCCWQSAYFASSPSVVSDRRLKTDISYEMDSRYDTLYANLKPASYQYVDGTSDRTHTGFVAQDVEEALEAAGLTDKEFAGVVRGQPDENGDYSYFLRYEEFVALNTYQIQKLMAAIANLEKRINKLEHNT